MDEKGEKPIRMDYMLRTTPATHSGESGSPLFLFKDEVPFIVGVTHGGRKPNTPTGADQFDYYNTYTFLASAIPWLEKEIGFKLGDSIPQNYRNLLCKISRTWGPLSLSEFLKEYQQIESTEIICNGESIQNIIAAKLAQAQVQAQKKEEVVLLAKQGVLSEYDYNEVMSTKVTHVQAIDVAKAGRSNTLSVYDYKMARAAGATHEQAVGVSTDAKANLLSVYDYKSVLEANGSHEQAIEVARLSRASKMSTYD